MELQPEYCKFGYDCSKPLKNPAIVYLRKCFVQYPLIGTYILSTVPLQYIVFSGLREIFILLNCEHENIVRMKEIAVGRSLESMFLGRSRVNTLSL